MGEWYYDGAFEQLFSFGRGEFEQKFSKNSNARGVARGGMLKFRFDWYTERSQTARPIAEIEVVAMDGASIFSLINALVSSRRSTFYQQLDQI